MRPATAGLTPVALPDARAPRICAGATSLVAAASPAVVKIPRRAALGLSVRTAHV